MFPLVVSEPTAGLSDHVTAALVVPETVAVTDCVWDGFNVPVVALSEITTGGSRVITAEAVVQGLAALIAVIVKVCGAEIVAGAV